MNLLSLLILILVLGLVFYLVIWILGQMPMPEPFKNIAKIIVGVICIILLLSVLFGGVSVPVLRIT